MAGWEYPGLVRPVDAVDALVGKDGADTETAHLYPDGTIGDAADSLGFFGDTPAVRQTAPAALTDSTGGTTDDVLTDVSATFSQATLNNNFAELAQDIASIRTALVNLGLIA
ncbi:MAG: hypothetical protein ACRDUY_08785 [Nitriliruptorales bacterium]